MVSSCMLLVHELCKLCAENVTAVNTCANAKHLFRGFFSFSCLSLAIPWTLLFQCSTHVKNPTEGLVLQACPCSPDGRRFPGICTCLFISAKVRVPQRTIASCCILASFHRDKEDCYPLDRLAVTPFLFPCLQVVQKKASF